MMNSPLFNYYCHSSFLFIYTCLVNIWPPFNIFDYLELSEMFIAEILATTEKLSIYKIIHYHIQNFLFFLPLFLKLSLVCWKKARRAYIRASGHRTIQPEARSFHSPGHEETKVSRKQISYLFHFLKFKNSTSHSSLVCVSEEIKWLDCQGFKARMTWICCGQEQESQAAPRTRSSQKVISEALTEKQNLVWLQHGPGVLVCVCVIVY